MEGHNDTLLEVENLQTEFHTDEGVVQAVQGVDFEVSEGETVCIVGESGSGKTVASESITRLIRTPPGEITADRIEYKGRDLKDLTEQRLEKIRGGEIAHIFQNPQGALNPFYTAGWQINEAIQMHAGVSKEEARRRGIELLDKVGIPEPTAAIDDYPHEFSGGQKQRIIIAMALAANPGLLIADEPTTALDVTIQSQILNLIQDLQEDIGMGVLFITHDLGVVAEIADRVVVMYAGKVMETGDVYEIFDNPSHPYTKALLKCLPGRGEETASIGGQLPDPMHPPEGCRFADRCPYANEQCRDGDQPPLYDLQGQDHDVSCVHYEPGADPSVISDMEHEGATSTTTRTDGGVDR